MDKKILELEMQVRKERQRREKLQVYKGDFPLFAEENVRILPKVSDDGFIPFVMNEAQQLIHSKLEEQRAQTGMVRAIILKARQQGISTYCAARSYWQTSLRDNVSTIIVAHLASASSNLFNMTRNMVFKHPEDTRPELEKASQNIIKFRGTESGYHVYTAGSPEAGRGSTPTIAHLSEVAFWPHDDKILAGLFQGIATAPGTEIIMESTANGATGEFHRMWEGAVNGENGFVPIFIPWFMTSEYSSPDNLIPQDFEMTQDEEEFAEEYGLTVSQMHWRRTKIAQSGEEKFKQEYPSNAHEAFLRSGSSVFNTSMLLQHIPMKPLVKKNYFSEAKAFEEAPQGVFEVFEYPSFQQGYVIGADIALGVGGTGDYSVAVVMDDKMRVVAVYRDNEIDPGTFGDALVVLGRYFNTAHIVCESNTYGAGALAQLENLKYPNLYRSPRVRQEGLKAGFTTTVSSKPDIIALLQRAIVDDTIRLSSNRILHECLNYVQKDNGKMEANGEGKDDCVIATALCLEGLRSYKHMIRPSSYWATYDDMVDNTQWL